MRSHGRPGTHRLLRLLPAAPPAGFGGGEAAIAAGFIGQALADMDRRDAGTSLGGEVRVFDLVQGGLRKYETVAVDRCERCGSRYDRLRHPTAAIAHLV